MSSQQKVDAITITTKITKSELYEFIMFSNYKSLRGLFSVLFSLVALAGTIYFWKDINTLYKIIMIFMSMMFTVVTPIEYYFRAAKQVKKNFKDEITYNFNEKGMTISIKEQSSTIEWIEVMKVVSSKNLVMIYSSPVRAFLVPKKNIGENFETLRELMENNTDCYKFDMN